MPVDVHLQALHRGVHVARRAARASFLAQHVPGLEGLPQFQLDPAVVDRPHTRKAEFEMRREPFRSKRIAAPGSDPSSTSSEILLARNAAAETVVQLACPSATSCCVIRLLPEPGDQGAQQQLLRQAHARVRRHFEGAQLHQAQPSGRRSGEYSLSMQNSARCVLPVTSTSRLRKTRSTSHGGQ